MFQLWKYVGYIVPEGRVRVKFENPGLGYMLESIMAFQKEDSSFFGPSLCSISILSLIKLMFPLSKERGKGNIWKMSFPPYIKSRRRP